MRTCLRCKGLGALPAIIHTKPEPHCWICLGFGQLVPLDRPQIITHVLSKHTPYPLRLEPPKPTHKEAMNLLTRRGAWGLEPQTIAAANQVWRGTVLGRRCTYVWCTLRGAAGYSEKGIRTAKKIDMFGTKYDPYKPELDALIEELKNYEHNRVDHKS